MLYIFHEYSRYVNQCSKIGYKQDDISFNSITSFINRERNVKMQSTDKGSTNHEAHVVKGGKKTFVDETVVARDAEWSGQRTRGQ